MLTADAPTKEAERAPGATPETEEPRLLSIRQGAAYLGCSFWTARDYVIQGLIPCVDMPPLAPRRGSRRRKTLRRVLIDRADLDAFVASRRRRIPKRSKRSPSARCPDSTDEGHPEAGVRAGVLTSQEVVE